METFWYPTPTNSLSPWAGLNDVLEQIQEENIKPGNRKISNYHVSQKKAQKHKKRHRMKLNTNQLLKEWAPESETCDDSDLDLASHSDSVNEDALPFGFCSDFGCSHDDTSEEFVMLEIEEDPTQVDLESWMILEDDNLSWISEHEQPSCNFLQVVSNDASANSLQFGNTMSSKDSRTLLKILRKKRWMKKQEKSDQHLDLEEEYWSFKEEGIQGRVRLARKYRRGRG